MLVSHWIWGYWYLVFNHTQVLAETCGGIDEPSKHTVFRLFGATLSLLIPGTTIEICFFCYVVD